MTKHDFINVRAFSVIDSSFPSITVRISLEEIESISIERGDNDSIIYAVYLEDGNVFNVSEEDGMKIIEMLRSRTAKIYNNV